MKKEHSMYIYNLWCDLQALKHQNPSTLEELNEFHGTTEQKWQLDVLWKLREHSIFTLERVCENEIRYYGMIYEHSKSEVYSKILEEWEFKLKFIKELLKITDIGEKTIEKNTKSNQKNREYHEEYVKKKKRKRANK